MGDSGERGSETRAEKGYRMMERIWQQRGLGKVLQAVLWGGERVSPAAGVVGCCVLVGVAAQVRIPLPTTDVPMTLQSLAVLLTGLALPPARAVTAMGLYLACGTVGLPVFAAGSGGLLGPTGGYLVGFFAAAWVVSIVKGGAAAGVLRMIIASVCGILVVFVMGLAWRVVWLGGDVGMAVLTGLTPFLAKASIQVVLAPMLMAGIKGGWRRRG